MCTGVLVWLEPTEEAVVGTEGEEHPDALESAALEAAAVPSVRHAFLVIPFLILGLGNPQGFHRAAADAAAV